MQNIQTKERVKDNTQNEKKLSIWERLLLNEIDITEVLTEDPYCFYYTCPQTNKKYGLGSFGNLVAINGKAKSRKITFLSGVLASAISGENVLGFNLDIPKNENIVYFDTEQGKFDAQRTIKRIFKQVNKEPHEAKNFRSFRLRQFDISERFDAFIEIVERLKPKLVVFDGIADFVNGINNENEITPLIDKIFAIIDKIDCMLMVVIHQNKAANDFNMTGVLGSSLVKKAQAVLQVQKIEKTEHSGVKSTELRGYSNFEEVVFGINEIDNTIFEINNLETKKDMLQSKINDCFNELGSTEVLYSLFLSAYIKTYAISEQTAYKNIQEAIKKNYIEKIGNTKNARIKHVTN